MLNLLTWKNFNWQLSCSAFSYTLWSRRQRNSRIPLYFKFSIIWKYSFLKMAFNYLWIFNFSVLLIFIWIRTSSCCYIYIVFLRKWLITFRGINDNRKGIDERLGKKEGRCVLEVPINSETGIFDTSGMFLL